MTEPRQILGSLAILGVVALILFETDLDLFLPVILALAVSILASIPESRNWRVIACFGAVVSVSSIVATIGFTLGNYTAVSRDLMKSRDYKVFLEEVCADIAAQRFEVAERKISNVLEEWEQDEFPQGSPRSDSSNEFSAE